VSSGGHRRANIDLEDPNFERTPYDRWRAYGRSKTANVLFAVAFDERFKAQGIRANALAPGRILTALQRHMTREELIARGAFDEHGVLAPDMKSPEQGAATSVWAAMGDELSDQGGLYLYDGAQAPRASASNPNGVDPYALDPASAAELWEFSRRAVQVA
jgi:NAD(P)-dependent dehydrogenase (short-subunit alcohol dehydrogenase family)